MNNTIKTTKTSETRAPRPQVFAIIIALATLLAVPAAKADIVNFGLGVSNGGVSLGISMNGHGSPAHHHRHRAPLRVAPRRGHIHPPVVVAPAPVVVVPSGYWREREERVWVEGCWVETRDRFGRIRNEWRPGRWEIRHTREWGTR